MKDFKITSNVLGMVDTNCYIIYREKGTEEQPAPCVIVDPADNASFIINRCRGLFLKPEAILLTAILTTFWRRPICAGPSTRRLWPGRRNRRCCPTLSGT